MAVDSQASNTSFTRCPLGYCSKPQGLTSQKIVPQMKVSAPERAKHNCLQVIAMTFVVLMIDSNHAQKTAWEKRRVWTSLSAHLASKLPMSAFWCGLL